MVLFALMLPVLLGMMGLGIDVAHIFRERRSLQNVADLAALAGASQIPDDPTSAENIAESVAAENGASNSEVTANAGYDGDETKIEVTVTRDLGLIFMPVFGLDSVTVEGRAVAAHSTSSRTTIFAKKDTHCWDEAIYWNSSNIEVTGDVHSNAAITMNGSDNQIDGSLTYKVGSPRYPIDQQESCEPDVHMNGVNPDIAPEPASWQDWPVLQQDWPALHQDWPAWDQDWPVPSDASVFFDECTYPVPAWTGGDLSNDGDWWVGGTSEDKQLKPGIICYEGSGWLRLNESGISGNVTFIAKHIDISGSNNQFTAFHDDVLFFATAEAYPTMKLGGSGNWQGLIFAPNKGQVAISGSPGLSIQGSIIAWAVKLNGNGWEISGNVGEGTAVPMHLVE